MSGSRYGATIAEMRRRQLGYREAAAVARISPAQLWKMLNGQQELRADVRERLRRCLLLPLDDEPTPATRAESTSGPRVGGRRDGT